MKFLDEVEVTERIKKFNPDKPNEPDITLGETFRYTSIPALEYAKIDAENIPKLFEMGKILGYRIRKRSDIEREGIQAINPDNIFESFIDFDFDYDVAEPIYHPDNIRKLRFRIIDLQRYGILKPDPVEQNEITVEFVKEYNPHVKNIKKLTDKIDDKQAISVIAQYLKDEVFISITDESTKIIKNVFKDKPAEQWTYRVFPRRLIIMFAILKGYKEPKPTPVDNLIKESKHSA